MPDGNVGREAKAMGIAASNRYPVAPGSLERSVARYVGGVQCRGDPIARGQTQRGIGDQAAGTSWERLKRGEVFIHSL